MDWTFLTGLLAVVFLIIAVVVSNALWALGVTVLLVIATVAGLVGETRR